MLRRLHEELILVEGQVWPQQGLDDLDNPATVGVRRERLIALPISVGNDPIREQLAVHAAKIDRREACALETSIAKLTGLETVMRVTDKALDVLGGRGYFADYPYPLERISREARINLAEEGTPSIQRLVMARALLEKPAPLAIGTLGAPYQPDGTDPALGQNTAPDLSYTHDPENMD